MCKSFTNRGNESRYIILFAVEPQQRRVSILDYLTKGKGKVYEEEIGRGERERPQGFNSAPAPNSNFPDPQPADDSTDEGTIASNTMCYVYRRTCFVTQVNEVILL